MTLHPVTHLIIALDIALAIVVMPPLYGAIAAAGCLAALARMPSRNTTILTRPFVKLFVIGAVFLFLIHAVRWHPPGISPGGITAMLGAVARIGAVITAVLYLAGRVTGEELYALMIDLNVPPPAILILFRTIWLVPRFVGRIDEVMLAQRLRGMRIQSFRDRARAVLPALTPVFASMLDETYAHAMTMTIRGFLEPGRKTHVIALRFGRADRIAAVCGMLAGLVLAVGARWF